MITMDSKVYSRTRLVLCRILSKLECPVYPRSCTESCGVCRANKIQDAVKYINYLRKRLRQEHTL
jgi:hypothetical protein